MEHATRVGPNVGYYVPQHKLLLFLPFRPFRLNPRSNKFALGAEVRRYAPGYRVGLPLSIFSSSRFPQQSTLPEPEEMDSFEGRTTEELREFLIPVANSVAMCRLAVVASWAALTYDWSQYHIFRENNLALTVAVYIITVLCLRREVGIRSLSLSLH